MIEEGEAYSTAEGRSTVVRLQRGEVIGDTGVVYDCASPVTISVGPTKTVRSIFLHIHPFYLSIYIYRRTVILYIHLFIFIYIHIYLHL